MPCDRKTSALIFDHCHFLRNLRDLSHLIAIKKQGHVLPSRDASVTRLDATILGRDMLTIYGVYRSRATRTFWLADELDLQFNHVPVIQARRLSDPLAIDAPLNTLSAEFRAINPMGTIPCIQDDDLVLYESMAINLYLARRYGGEFGPNSPREEGLMMQWSFFAATEIETNALKISTTIAEDLGSSEMGQAVLDVSARLLKRPFGVLEQHLAQHDYLVGNRFTVADINMAEVVRYAQGHDGLFEAHPAVKKWLETCQSRRGFKAMWEKRSAEPA
jgi:glutathione S-transferase